MTGNLKDLLDRAVDWYEAPDRLLDAARQRLDRRRRRRRVSAGVLAVVVSMLGGFLAWRAFQPPADRPGFVGDTGWYRVGNVDDLRASRIVYVAEIETFVVAQPGEDPYALSASSPHLGERLLFCRMSGWFFSPAHGETFDLHGNLELGPASSGMIGRPVRVVDGIVEIDSRSQIAPAPIADGRADPEPSGPSCLSGTDPVVEDEPGFAGISGDLPAAERFPLEIVEGVRPGDTVQNPAFVGAEVGFPATELLVRLVGADGSILDEQLVSCEGGACPGVAYADLIFSVDAPQRATVLFATVHAELERLFWIHHIPITVEPPPGVAPGSFVGTWYDEEGNPTYFKDERGWHLELHVINGAEHCGWQSASFLTLAWPLGSDFRGASEGAARSYVRDPEGVLGGDDAVPPPDLVASLPDDASYTGYHRGDWQLWVSPSDVDQAVYLVARGRAVERWPRAEHRIVCT
jgi:nitrite reductase/ring-hydroxylating ferredoxin subunit